MASFIHSAHGREMKCSVAGKCNRLEKNKIIGMKREAHRWSSAPCWRDMGNVIDSRAMHLWFEFVSVELHFSWAEVKLRKFIEIGFFFSGRRIDSLIIENQRKQMREIGHFPLSLFPPAYTHTQTKIKAIAKLDSAPKSIENQLKINWKSIENDSQNDNNTTEKNSRKKWRNQNGCDWSRAVISNAIEKMFGFRFFFGHVGAERSVTKQQILTSFSPSCFQSAIDFSLPPPKKVVTTIFKSIFVFLFFFLNG